MARLDDALDLRGDGHHQRSVGGRKENLFHRRRFLKVADDRVGDEHRIVGHFRLAESIDALAEGSDDGEG